MGWTNGVFWAGTAGPGVYSCRGNPTWDARNDLTPAIAVINKYYEDDPEK